MYSFNRLSLRTIWVSCIWYDSQGPLRGLGSMLEPFTSKFKLLLKGHIFNGSFSKGTVFWALGYGIPQSMNLFQGGFITTKMQNDITWFYRIEDNIYALVYRCQSHLDSHGHVHLLPMEFLPVSSSEQGFQSIWLLLGQRTSCNFNYG